jgi:amino acid adenylation domain-containing protein
MFNKSDVQDVYPLTPMQEGMLFHYLMDKEAPVYFEQIILTVAGKLDLDLFEKTFNHILATYDVLRTVFVYDKLKKPMQVVLKQRKGSVYFEDICDMDSEAEKAQRIEVFKHEDKLRGFKLEKDLLFRLSVLKTHEDKYCIFWSNHHIIMDGWCMGLLIRDFMTIYGASSQGESLTKEPPAAFANYVQWLQQQDKQKGLNYWTLYLEGYEQQASLPHTKSQTKDPGYDVAEHNFNINESLSRGIGLLAKTNSMTVTSVLQGVFGILLQRYNDTQDVVFATVVSGRPPEVEGIESMVGLFINSIPVRVKCVGSQSFMQLLTTLHQNANDAKPFEYLPLADIQANSPLKGDLIDVSMGYQNYPVQKSVEMGEKVDLEILDMDSNEHSSYDFNCIISSGESLVVSVNYNRRVYSNETVVTVSRHIVTIIEAVVANPQIVIKEIPLLSFSDQEQLLVHFNDTGSQPIVKKPIHQLFRDQAQRTPDHTAISFRAIHDSFQEVLHIPYRQLDEGSENLARRLHGSSGIDRETPIGVLMGNNHFIAETLLGILKAGAAYVPLLPGLPDERLKAIIVDAGIKTVLTLNDHREYAEHLSEICPDLDHIDYVDNSTPFSNSGTPLPEVSSHNLAYIIYTSGTTGTPKGIMIEHAGLVNFALFRVREHDLTGSDTALQLISPSFDGYAANFYPPLISGGCVVLVDETNRLNIHYIDDLMKTCKVTHFALIPSMYRHLLDGLSEDAFVPVRSVTLAAEAANPQLIRDSRERYPHVVLTNEYGPTEATVAASFLPGMTPDDVSIIGKPIPHARIYILGKNRDLLPIGVPGELCIAGIGLARGYLRRPELDNVKFLSLSFSPQHSERIYCTGDLARWLPEGNIQFIGRIDTQIKIRGFRVEPEEVRALLLTYYKSSINDAVVTAVEDQKGDLKLCAYIVGKGNYHVDDPQLRRYLSKQLPDYMVPTHIVTIPSIPLTFSGKIDYNALPKPGILDGEAEQKTENIPLGETETKLRLLWSQVLGIKEERIGANADFFQLGGHSLKAMSLANVIHKAFNKRIEVQRIFQCPTLSILAQEIDMMDTNLFAAIPRQPEQPYYELSYAQKRLWVLQQRHKQSGAFSISETVTIKGKVSQALIKDIMTRLIQRHESFRTSFREEAGEIVQVVAPLESATIPIELVDLTHLNDEQRQAQRLSEPIAEGATVFDLEQSPLLRIKLLYCANDETDLIFTMHHLISDGWSMMILHREFLQLYRELSAGNDIQLPPLNLQYRDYAVWHNQLLTDQQKLEPVLRFWQRRLNGSVPMLDLPYDTPKNMMKSSRSAGYHFFIPGDVTAALRKLTGQHNTSMFTLLLAALNMLLSFLRGQSGIVIAIPGAARPHQDVKEMIGMFVNTLVLKTDVSLSENFIDFLKRVTDDTMQVLEYQAYPMEMIFEHLGIQYPEISVFFNMLNMMETQQLEGRDFTAGHTADVHETKFPLLFYVQEFENGINIACDYFKELFEPATIEKIARMYIKICTAIAQDSTKPITQYKSTGKRKKISRGTI